MHYDVVVHTIMEDATMHSLLSPSSRQLTGGFPNNGPANSGEHIAKFFLAAPNGVKQERHFDAVTRTGVPYQERVVSYSMISTFEGESVVWWIKLRKSDFAADGTYGDSSMERLLDELLSDAMASGESCDIPIVAASDYIDRQGNEHVAKDGIGFLA